MTIVSAFETYQKVLKHREVCSKWGKGFCMECFGGGLDFFTENIMTELGLDELDIKKVMRKKRGLLDI